MIYLGKSYEFLRNDEIFPKFAAKFGSLRITARHEAVQQTYFTLDCFVVPPRYDAKLFRINN